MTVRFSLWFPDYSDASDFSSLNDPESNEWKGVVASTFTVLCAESDVSIVRSNLDLASQDNLCLSEFGSQLRFLQSTDGPSIISSEPEVLVRRISGEQFSWSTWIMRFSVFQVGSAYYEKAVRDDPEKGFAELEKASAEAMEEDLQLMIDSSIIAGRFDEVLASTFEDSLQVFSSPIRKEEEIFQEIRSRVFPTILYNAKRFSAMRISGIVLFLLTQGTLLLLWALARRRRRKLDRKERLGQAAQWQTAKEAPQGAEAMPTSPSANGVSRTTRAPEKKG